MNETMSSQLKRLKKLCRRVTREELIEGGIAALQATGLDEDQIEDIAQDIGLDGETFAYSVATAGRYGAAPSNRDKKRGDPSAAGSPLIQSCGRPTSNNDTPEIQRRIAEALGRIADHFDPPPPDVVGTPYVADRLACTTVWITQMIRSGEIPSSCIVPGTGHGKPWKFYRRGIESWMESR